MRARKFVGPLVLLAGTLLASSAFAITPITNAQEKIRNEIAQQLAPQKSYALVIGISEFDNPDWPDLQGVDREVADVSAALIAQHFQIVPESAADFHLNSPVFLSYAATPACSVCGATMSRSP